MPFIEVPDALASAVAEYVRKIKLTPAQYAAEQRAKADAKLTPEQKAARDAEQERVRKLTPAQRMAERLVAEKKRVETQLARPEIAAEAAKLDKDGKAKPAKEV